MAVYKVSYKVLHQQGEDIKAVAKLVGGYSERVEQIYRKLGSDALFAEVRGNLQKLKIQLGESGTVLNTSGDLLTKSVEEYTNVETRQVKKVDSMKAHNRDFYKNPIVVASVGGSASGAMDAPATSTTTVNYTNNSVNVATITDTQPVSQTEPIKATVTDTVQPDGGMMPTSAHIAGAVTGGVFGAATAGGVAAALHMKNKHNRTQKVNQTEDILDEGYDPQAELEKAIDRVRALEDDSI